MDFDSFLAGVAWLLVLEGLLPLLAPARWRDTFRQLLVLRDGQLRFFGLLSVGAGVMLLLWLG